MQECSVVMFACMLWYADPLWDCLSGKNNHATLSTIRNSIIAIMHLTVLKCRPSKRVCLSDWKTNIHKILSTIRNNTTACCPICFDRILTRMSILDSAAGNKNVPGASPSHYITFLVKNHCFHDQSFLRPWILSFLNLRCDPVHQVHLMGNFVPFHWLQAEQCHWCCHLHHPAH